MSKDRDRVLSLQIETRGAVVFSKVFRQSELNFAVEELTEVCGKVVTAQVDGVSDQWPVEVLCRVLLVKWIKKPDPGPTEKKT